MAIKTQHIMGVLLFAAVGGVSWWGYAHFFDIKAPEVTVVGLESGSYYRGDTRCGLVCSKKSMCSIMLDGQLLTGAFKASSGKEHPFVIPTHTMANGKHTLRVTAVDTSYHRNDCAVDTTFYVDNVPLQAALIKTDNEFKVFQGRTFHVQLQANKEIKGATVNILSQSYPCYRESKNSLVYECFVPIACEEQPNEYPFCVEVVDNVNNNLTLDNKFQVVVFPFKKQNLAIDEKKIEHEKEMGLSIVQRQQVLHDLALKSPAERLWKGSFCAPIDIARVTCEFGTVRTTKEKGRYAHKALDVISAPRSVVWATQDGVVALKDRFVDSGNTVVIDHGMGILSLFYHLENFADVSVGQKIAKGSPIGTLGMTGYATGYHLHWEMRINDIEVDPMQWTKIGF